MRRVLPLLAAMAAIVCQDAAAQVSSLRGRVVDEHGQPLSGVTVAIRSATDGQSAQVTTTGDGAYVRLGLAPGDYALVFTKTGFRELTVTRSVEPGATEVDPVTLKEAPSGFAGVTARQLEHYRKDFARGAELMQAGRLDEAEAVFAGIVAKAPSITDAHVNLSHIYRQKQDWASAERELLLVLEAAPGRDAYLALADVYWQAHRTDDLRTLLARAVTLFATDAVFQLEAGVHYVNLGELAVATAAFERAAQLDPSRAAAEYYLGAVALRRRDNAAASAHLQKYLSIAAADDPNLALARQTLESLQKSQKHPAPAAP